MMKLPLSVFIIAKNEEDRIASVINLVKDFADEVLVIDSGSLDKTVDVAMKSGAKVIFNEWQGYGPQKIFGEKSCKNDWILNIDADEEVSPELAREIITLFHSPNLNAKKGYKVKIVNKFRFEKKPKKFAYYYNQLRLYNKNHAGFKDSAVHDSVNLFNSSNLSEIGQLNHIIYHQSFRSFQHWIEKINAYSTMQAKEALEKGKKVSIIKILLTPIFSFFKAYVIRRYFIYGVDGVIYSFLFAFSRFVKAIKIREAMRVESHL
ncbi:MAG: glycosyltransferase family 2 protein [Rickettsiales bacterium]|nr:glycosyltransferase family 2 protein [Rickettsiales bacterium]